MVEPITVVLLLGILSVCAASRMLGSNAYTPVLVVSDVIAVSCLGRYRGHDRVIYWREF